MVDLLGRLSYSAAVAASWATDFEYSAPQPTKEQIAIEATNAQQGPRNRAGNIDVCVVDANERCRLFMSAPESRYSLEWPSAECQRSMNKTTQRAIWI